MGVNWRHYVIYGVRLAYEALDKVDKKVVEEMDMDNDDFDKSKLGILEDGMNGEYAIVGFLVARTEDGREEQADFPVTDLPLEFSPAFRKEITKFLMDNKLTTDAKLNPHYIVLTHYT